MKNKKFIKLKKVVKGLDENDVNFTNGNFKFSDVYVQITQDSRGTTISLDGVSISLTELGYRLVKDCWS